MLINKKIILSSGGFCGSNKPQSEMKENEKRYKRIPQFWQEELTFMLINKKITLSSGGFCGSNKPQSEMKENEKRYKYLDFAWEIESCRTWTWRWYHL